MDAPASKQPQRRIGRYAIFEEIASGGMAHGAFGSPAGPVGFSRVVAVKCLHPHLPRSRIHGDVHRRGAPRGAHSPPQRGADARRGGERRRARLGDGVRAGRALALVTEGVSRRSAEHPAGHLCRRHGGGCSRGSTPRTRRRGEWRAARNRASRHLPSEHPGRRRRRCASPRFRRRPRDADPQETKPGMVKGKSAYMAPEQIAESASIAAPTSLRPRSFCGRF